ncbi:hypothetical protein FOCC_FOCC014006, partial [Frankliniella occidentalis]
MMSRKTKVAYKMVFQNLKDLVPGIRLPKVMSDFEKALLGALREEFPNAVLTGCLFHCDQAMCKWTIRFGLVPLLEVNDDMGKIVRMCMALPFLPPERIIQGFEDVNEYARGKAFYEQIEGFLNYVNQTWLQDVGPDHLSVHRRFRRTNNDMESYHRTLVDTIGKGHPNIWAWI